jgi:hypothetical protein
VHEIVTISPEAQIVRDSQYLWNQAARCRRLASDMLDKKTIKSLTELAERYDRQAAAIEGHAEGA